LEEIGITAEHSNGTPINSSTTSH